MSSVSSSARLPRRLSPSRRRVVADIVQLVTPDYPELDPSERTRVHSSVTAFVTSQIEAMPSFMALPYRTAITAFRLLPLVRFGKRFEALDRQTQVAYLGAWSDAKLGPFRDFVKLIRSCALLAYFDHPVVVRHLPVIGEARLAATADVR